MPDAFDPDSSLLGNADAFVELARWAAEARVDDADRSREHRHWMHQLASEESTFTSVLVDVSERAQPAVLTTTFGRRHRGVIEAVATNFCAIRTDRGHQVLLAIDSVHTVRLEPRAAASSGHRRLGIELTLADMLARLAVERPTVFVVTGDGGDGVRGELRSVGRDVATLRLDGSARDHAYLRIGGIAEVVVESW